MSLQVSAVLRQRDLEVDLGVAEGEHVAILGENGSGKSTLLGLVAGTLHPDEGTAHLDGRTLFDTHHRRWLPPHRRGVALLAQDPLLFPHLGVRENVAFAPRAAGRSRSEAHARADRWLDEVEALPLADRRPHEISGGQAQRVAIARALAAEPRLLLLDEPMAALDVSVAPVLRRVLRRVLEGRTTLLVTHDLLDALLLSDRVLVLENGRVVDSGPTEEALRHPRARFTARLAGLNLLRGVRTPTGVDADGLHVDGTPRDGGTSQASGPAAAAFSPADVAVYVEAPAGSPRNNLAVTVTEIEPHGDLVRVHSDDHHGHRLAADVTPRAVAELDLYPGRAVIFSVKAAAVAIYAT